jgi:putative endonuclease
MTALFDPDKAQIGALQLELPFDAPLQHAPTNRAAPELAVHHVRRSRGRMAYLSGLAAEEAVMRQYADRGMVVLAQRWRGSCAEIDLILQDGAAVIFVEVKKSRSFDAALLSLGRAQRRWIMLAAGEYLGSVSRHQMTEMRFNLAMMNDTGAIQIVENAFAEGD